MPAMPQIIPAIIAQDTAELKKKIEIVSGLVQWIQVDIMDGDFVPPKTWPYTGGAPNDIRALAGNLKIEVHLMVSHPERVVREWVDAGVHRILVHVESTRELGVVADILEGTGVEFGIALKAETSVEAISPWLETCDAVQLMSIPEIGYHGKTFDEGVIPKIEALRARYPNLPLCVDGGITAPIAFRLASLGVENIAVGGAIWNAENPRRALEQLLADVRGDIQNNG